MAIYSNDFIGPLPKGGFRAPAQYPSNFVGPIPKGSTRTGAPTTQGVLGASSSNVNNNYQPQPQAPAGNDIIQQDINRTVDDFGAIIDRDFESALAELGAQEQNLRGTADVATQNVNTQARQAKTALQEQQGTALGGIQTQEQTAQKQSASALQQARDLNRQLQQQNIAQLSSLGISSSSVSEALAERLGVETARRIAGVTGSRDEILQNLQAERSKINNVAAQKLSDLEQTVGAQIAEIQNNLLSGIRQINVARDTAARDKANRRAELLSSAQSQIAQLKAQQARFQQELEAAAQRRQQSVDQTLNLLTSTPADFSNLTSNVQALTPALQATGLQFSNISPSGKFTLGPARLDKTQEDEEIF